MARTFTSKIWPLATEDSSLDNQYAADSQWDVFWAVTRRQLIVPISCEKTSDTSWSGLHRWWSGRGRLPSQLVWYWNLDNLSKSCDWGGSSWHGCLRFHQWFTWHQCSFCIAHGRCCLHMNAGVLSRCCCQCCIYNLVCSKENIVADKTTLAEAFANAAGQVGMRHVWQKKKK